MQVERKGLYLYRYSSGERVSNTWVICPALWDKPGKLGLIPYRTASWMVWWKAFAVWDEPAASRRQVERRRNRLWNLIRIRDDEVVLGNRHRHTANICFLEGIGAQEVRAHLASNGHDWNRVQVGIRNWRN